MRFLYTMSIFMSLERIRNRLDDIFVFKEPEKEVKISLHDASLHNVNFLQAWKEINGLKPLILGLKSVIKES